MLSFRKSARRKTRWSTRPSTANHCQNLPPRSPCGCSVFGFGIGALIMSQTTTILDTAAVLDTLLKSNKIYRNLRSGPLVEHSIRREEGLLADNGALVAYTGKFTGRTPKDKFTVKDPVTAEKVNWGDVNFAFDPEKFDALFERVVEFLRGRELYVQDLYAGADPQYRLPIRVIKQYAWHNLFIRSVFIRPAAEELPNHSTVVSI